MLCLHVGGGQLSQDTETHMYQLEVVKNLSAAVLCSEHYDAI